MPNAPFNRINTVVKPIVDMAKVPTGESSGVVTKGSR